MKLKIQFRKEVHFNVSKCQGHAPVPFIRFLSLRKLVMAEKFHPVKHRD